MKFEYMWCVMQGASLGKAIPKTSEEGPEGVQFQEIGLVPDALNALGQEGWTLVCASGPGFLFFARPIAAEPEPQTPVFFGKQNG